MLDELFSDKDRIRLIKGRKKRGLSQQDLAKMLECPRGTLANYEAQERIHVPRQPMLGKIRELLRNWDQEDLRESAGEILDQPRIYAADSMCPHCAARVPGAPHGARYCLLCGTKFEVRVCKGCGNEVDPHAVYCSQCGTRV